jgi:hypothetical protein
VQLPHPRPVPARLGYPVAVRGHGVHRDSNHHRDELGRIRLVLPTD